MEGVVSLYPIYHLNNKLSLFSDRQLRDVFLGVLQQRRTNKIFTLFVLMVESGMLYVVMLVSAKAARRFMLLNFSTL